MTNLEFMEFQKEFGYGHGENQENNTYKKDVNNIKSEMFTLSDWQKESEHYIKSHIWDCGKGKFSQTANLEKELINIK